MATDISKFTAGLTGLQAQLVEAVVAGVRDAGLQILGNAQDYAPVGGGEFSPKDLAPGTLKASANHQGPVLDGTVVRMLIGFNTVYAARQHEELTWRHEEPGRAKYLEVAMAEEPELLAKSIQHHVTQIPKGGT